MRKPVFPNTVVMFAPAPWRLRVLPGRSAGPDAVAGELVRCLCAERTQSKRALLKPIDEAGGKW